MRFGFDFEYTRGSGAIAMSSNEDEQKQQPNKKNLISTAITHYAKLEKHRKRIIGVACFWGFWIRMVEYCLCILDSREERELSRNEKKNNFCGVWYCKKAGSWKNLMVILNE